MTIQSPLRDWSGKTCVVVAGGPSLTTGQYSTVCRSNAKVIAVNNVWELFLTRADAIYAGDFLWWKVKHQEIRKMLPGAPGQAKLWTQDSTAAERYQLNRVKGVNRPGLGVQHIHQNGNSGMQAINLAYLFGCRRILLLGFDMKVGEDGAKHWHSDHPAPLMQTQLFSEWLHKGKKLAFDLKANGCEVVNCTPGSAWLDFPMSTIEGELCQPQ